MRCCCRDVACYYAMPLICFSIRCLLYAALRVKRMLSVTLPAASPPATLLLPLIFTLKMRCYAALLFLPSYVVCRYCLMPPAAADDYAAAVLPLFFSRHHLMPAAPLPHATY